MTKNEILLLLREGLGIQFFKTPAAIPGESRLTVRLTLYNEEISEDFQTIKEGEWFEIPS